MTSTRTGVCAWCGATLSARSARGPIPLYCRPSHRQRAFESRVSGRAATASEKADDDGDLDQALDRLAAAVSCAQLDPTAIDGPASSAHYRELHLAACAVLVARGRDVPSVTPGTTRQDPIPSPTGRRSAPGRGSGPAAKASRASRSKPWKVVQHRRADQATAPGARTVTAHTTERAALTSARQLRQLWDQHQGAERNRWEFAAIADPSGSVEGEELSKPAAQQWAGCLQVPVAADSNVVYQRRPVPGWPPTVAIERVEGHSREPLNLRWHRGPGGYLLGSPVRTWRDAHPYLANLLYDACELAYLYPAVHCRQLLTVLDDFASDVLDSLGDTWSLDASTIHAWLEQRRLITVIPHPPA